MVHIMNIIFFKLYKTQNWYRDILTPFSHLVSQVQRTRSSSFKKRKGIHTTSIAESSNLFASVYHLGFLPISHLTQHPHIMQVTTISANIVTSILSKLNALKWLGCGKRLAKLNFVRQMKVWLLLILLQTRRHYGGVANWHYSAGI